MTKKFDLVAIPYDPCISSDCFNDVMSVVRAARKVDRYTAPFHGVPDSMTLDTIDAYQSNALCNLRNCLRILDEKHGTEDK